MLGSVVRFNGRLRLQSFTAIAKLDHGWNSISSYALPRRSLVLVVGRFPFVCGVAAFGLLLLPWMEWFRTPDLPGVGLSDAAFTGWINSLREGWRGWLPLLALAFGTASSLFVTIRSLIPNFWNQARPSGRGSWTKTEEVAWKRFGPLWMGLYDERDEAIAFFDIHCGSRAASCLSEPWGSSTLEINSYGKCLRHTFRGAMDCLYAWSRCCRVLSRAFANGNR